MLNFRLLVRGVIAVVVVVASLGVGLLPTASAVTTPRPINDTRPASAAPVTVDFPIEYFGVVGELPAAVDHLEEHGPAPFGEARFRVDGKWTPWQRMKQEGAQAPGQFTGALISVDGADAYQVRGLPPGARSWRAAAINTTDGESVVTGQRPANSASAASACRSRADWGADESIAGWARGATQAYAPVQALTVHHTAGSNSSTQDYSATVRAIYSYHVQTNGWQDIGYQYLIDGNGVVYEGRNAGHTSRSCLSGNGDGSDFAHEAGSDRLVTGAHVGGWNTGNLGISLMGCFDPASGCSGTTTPRAGAIDGLENLLARASTRHDLDPTGSIRYFNSATGASANVRTISGHGDWMATACPGSTLYAQLPAIRSAVADLMTPATTVPAAPTAVTATAGDGAATVSWTPPANDGGLAITGYLVTVVNSSGATVGAARSAGANATSLVVSGLSNGLAYRFRVQAQNSAGTGPSSALSNAVTPVSATPPVSLSRLWGQTQFDTAAAISRDAFPAGATTVYVATGNDFPDALAAAPSAKLLGAPILLVNPGSIPAPTAQELVRLAPDHIILLGGPLAVTAAVEQALDGYADAGTVTRLWGETQYHTAAAISAATFAPGVAKVYVATGEDFPDALAGGAVAAREGVPVILVETNSIPAPSAAELDRLNPASIVVLGGPVAVAASVATQRGRYTTPTTGRVSRIWGQSAYETAIKVSQSAYPSPAGSDVVYLATGGGFPDALAASPVAGTRNAPVLLLPPDGTVPPDVAAEIQRLTPQRVVVLGGELAITAGQYNAIAALFTPPSP